MLTTNNLPKNQQYKDNDIVDIVQDSIAESEVKSLNALHEFPTDGFCDEVQALLNHIMVVRQVPVEYVAAPLLSATSIAIGNKAEVIYYAYSNPLMTWNMVIGASGTGKSLPMKDLLKPIFGYNRELHKEYERAISNNPDTEKDITYKQLLLSDCTPEYMYQAVADNPHGVLLYRDEIAGFFKDIGRYNSSGEVEHSLSMFDYTLTQINRKTQKQLLIEKPYLSMLGGIQPNVMPKAFKDESMVWSGFFSRFLFFYPNHVEYKPIGKASLDKDIMQSWYNRIQNLYCNTTIPDGTKIYLSDEADALYSKFDIEITAKQNSILGEDNKSCFEKSMLSKLRIHALRLAGLCQMINCAIKGDCCTISEKAMQWAISACWYFADAQKRVYDVVFGTNSGSKMPTRKEVFSALKEWYPGASMAKMADTFGISRQAISQFLK